MAEPIDALVEHIGRERRAEVVVWEHNSHLGDARFTEMGRQGELNVGQLMRERYGDRAVLKRQSHYFHALLPQQFDAMIHIDETRAVEPLERVATVHEGEVAETYPSGI